MKKYTKILEAINRGINLALDDFDDEELTPLKKSKQVYNRDYTKEYLDIMSYFVDLGLPSGTLWAKYNLGVNPNKLNHDLYWNGGYYQWGEIQPVYNAAEDGVGVNIDKTRFVSIKEKYHGNYETGVNSIYEELQPEDDAAYQTFQKYNSNIRMSVKEQNEELIKYTKYEYIKNYKVNGKEIDGLNGIEFISKINGQKLFIPAAGFYDGSGLCNAGERCLAWSSSLRLDYPFSAYSLYFDYDDAFPDIDNFRCYGLSVRPVFQG